MKIKSNEIEVIDRYNSRIVIRPHRFVEDRVYITQRQYDRIFSELDGGEWDAWDHDGNKMTVDIVGSN